MSAGQRTATFAASHPARTASCSFDVVPNWRCAWTSVRAANSANVAVERSCGSVSVAYQIGPAASQALPPSVVAAT